MILCPRDCSRCDEAECRRDGCRFTGEPMFETCELCGELYVPLCSLIVCVACLECEP